MTQQVQLTKPVGNADEINSLLRRYGVKFGIYKNGVFHEQFFPFDPIPRVISAGDFQRMEKGLVQRVNALNEFLFDIYHEKKIIKDIWHSAKESHRKTGYTATFPALIWCRRKTANGIF